jgi:hypothetical protein
MAQHDEICLDPSSALKCSHQSSHSSDMCTHEVFITYVCMGAVTNLQRETRFSGKESSPEFTDSTYHTTRGSTCSFAGSQLGQGEGSPPQEVRWVK